MDYMSIDFKPLFEAMRGGTAFAEVYIPYIFKGRELEKRAVETDITDVIQSKMSKCRLFLADYGGGKSTLGKFISYCGQERGMLISVLSDKDYKNIDKQDDFFISIMRNLQMSGLEPGSNALKEIMEAWSEEQLSQLSKDTEPQSIEQVTQYLKERHDITSELFLSFSASYLFSKFKGKTTDPLVGYLCGESVHKNILKFQYGFTHFLDNNGLAFLRDFSLFLQSLGIPGIVIILDELETLTSKNSNVLQRTYIFLREFWDLLLEGNTSGIFGVLLSTEEWINDTKKGVKSYPALYERFKNGNNKQNSKSPMIFLEALVEKDYRELYDELFSLYDQTYALDFGSMDALSQQLWDYLKLRNSSFDGEINAVSPRDFIKDIVNALDSIADYLHFHDDGELLEHLEAIISEDTANHQTPGGEETDAQFESLF